MKKTINKALILYSKLFFSSVFCLVISAFIALVFNFTYSTEIGYDAKGYKEGDLKEVYLYTHYFDDGEDTKLVEFEEKGYTINKYSIHSGTPKSKIVLQGAISQVINFVVLVIFIRTVAWDMGLNVATNKNSSKEEKSKFWGFKIGFTAMIPSYLMLILLTIFKSSIAKDFRVGIFKILNSSLYGLIDMICNETVLWGELKVYQIALLAVSLTIIPFITQFWFSLGKKGEFITDKIIYKK